MHIQFNHLKHVVLLVYDLLIAKFSLDSWYSDRSNYCSSLSIKKKSASVPTFFKTQSRWIETLIVPVFLLPSIQTSIPIVFGNNPMFYNFTFILCKRICCFQNWPFPKTSVFPFSFNKGRAPRTQKLVYFGGGQRNYIKVQKRNEVTTMT